MSDPITSGREIYNHGREAARNVRDSNIAGSVSAVAGAASIIADQLNYQPLADAVNVADDIMSGAVSGAATGSLAGPTGTIVGAAVGAAISFAKSIASSLGRGPTPAWEELVNDPPFPANAAVGIRFNHAPLDAAHDLYKLWRLTMIDGANNTPGFMVLHPEGSGATDPVLQEQLLTDIGIDPQTPWEKSRGATALRKLIRWAPSTLPGVSLYAFLPTDALDWPDPNPSVWLGAWVPWPFVALSYCALAELSDSEALQYFTALYEIYRQLGGGENDTFHYWIGRLASFPPPLKAVAGHILTPLERAAGKALVHGRVVQTGAGSDRVTGATLPKPKQGPSSVVLGFGAIGVGLLMWQVWKRYAH